MKRFILLAILVLFATTSCTKEYILSVDVSPNGSGQVVPDMGTFDEGTSVTLSAIPSEEYVFVRWSGDASGSNNPTDVLMTSDKNVTAQFALKKYPLNIETIGEGRVNETIVSTGKGTEYDSGTTVQLEAIPSTGYYFAGWSGDIQGNNNPANITIGEPKSVVARFEKENYLVEVKISGEGEVIKEIIDSNKSDEYPYGTRLRLTPEPEDGNIFLGWVIDGVASTDSIIEVDVDNVRRISASFEDELASQLLQGGVGKWKVRRGSATSKSLSFSNIIQSIQYGLSISSSASSTNSSGIDFPQFYKLYALLEFEKSTSSEGEIIAVDRYESISLVDILVGDLGIPVLDLNPIERSIVINPSGGQSLSSLNSSNTISPESYLYSAEGELQINNLDDGQFNAVFDLTFTPVQTASTTTSSQTLDTFEVEEEVNSDVDQNFQVGSLYIPLDYVEQRLVESGIDNVVDSYVEESLLLSVESLDLSGLSIDESDLPELYEVLLAFPNLQSLDLSNNSISSFDSSIIYLVNNLNLSSNLLTSIDVSFLSDDYTLNLSGNSGLTCIEVSEEFLSSPPSNLIVDDVSVLQLNCNCPELNLISGSLNQTLCEGVDSFESVVFEYSGENVSIEINDNSLPPGISYQTTSETITFSGNPSFDSQDSYSISVAVVKPNCDEAVQNITVSKNSSSASLTITGPLNQSIQTNNQIQEITVTYGGSTTGVDITGLPNTISISQSGNTYTISGFINQAGEYSGQITTQNSGGCGSTVQNITIIVTDPISQETSDVTTGSSETDSSNNSSEDTSQNEPVQEQSTTWNCNSDDYDIPNNVNQTLCSGDRVEDIAFRFGYIQQGQVLRDVRIETLTGGENLFEPVKVLSGTGNLTLEAYSAPPPVGVYTFRVSNAYEPAASSVLGITADELVCEDEFIVTITVTNCN